jgi:tripartite-type tricarboxylate transporter receptor subunit TctC
LVVIVVTSLALPLCSSLAQSDYFPSRPITIVIPFTPGGSADVLMRLVGQKLSESVKQPASARRCLHNRSEIPITMCVDRAQER